MATVRESSAESRVATLLHCRPSPVSSSELMMLNPSPAPVLNRRDAAILPILRMEEQREGEGGRGGE